MKHHILATRIGRNASALSRRASLIGLGATLLTAGAGAPPARAGKAGRKAKKTCQRQVGACEASVHAFCDGPSVEEDERDACRAGFLPCCSSFTGCDAAAAYACFIDVLRNPPPN